MAKKTVLLSVTYPIHDYVTRGIEVSVDKEMSRYEIEEAVRVRILDAIGGSVLGFPIRQADVGDGVEMVIDHGIQDRGYLDDYNEQPEFREWLQVNVEEE